MKQNELVIHRRSVKVNLIGSTLLLVVGFGAMFVGGVGIAYEGLGDTLDLKVFVPFLIFATGVLLTVRGIFRLPYKLFPFGRDKEGDLLRKELRNRESRV